MRLVTDTPLNYIHDQRERNDSLSFSKYVNAIYGSIKDVEGRFTLGIHGRWGSGKTSLMKLLEDKIKTETTKRTGKDKERDTLTVWFDAWRYEKEANLLFPLIGVILKTINEKEKENSSFFEVKERLLAIIKSLKFKVKTGSEIIGANWEASLSSDDIKAKLKELETNLFLEKSTYFSLYDSLDKERKKSDCKIIIFIDDLDRCLPNASIKLLEQIKLILDQDGFIFIIGAAKGILENYLSHIFKKEYGMSDNEKLVEAKKYLDKIIQLPISLPYPPPPKEFNNFLKALCKEAQFPEEQKLEELVELITIISKENPRDAIRFINTIIVSSRIGKKDLEDIALDEGVRGFRSEWTEAWSFINSEKIVIKAIRAMKSNIEGSEKAILTVLKKEKYQHHQEEIKKRLFEDKYFIQLINCKRNDDRFTQILTNNTLDENSNEIILSNEKSIPNNFKIETFPNLIGSLKVFYPIGMSHDKIIEEGKYSIKEEDGIKFEEFSVELIETEEYFLEPYSDINDYHLWLPKGIENIDDLDKSKYPPLYSIHYKRLYDLLDKSKDKKVIMYTSSYEKT